MNCAMDLLLNRTIGVKVLTDLVYRRY